MGFTVREPLTAEQLARIRHIEEVAADAVPAAVTEYLDGWRLRFNHGVKRRPNSVLAAERGVLSLTAKVARAEAFYAAHGLKARFQLSPASLPEGLDAFLTARGYGRVPEAVSVQVASLETSGEARAHSGATVKLLEHPNKTFLDLYCDTEGLSGHRAAALTEMLGRLPGKAAFALVYVEDRPAATGVGVVHGGLLGVFNIATAPSARRRGLASAAVTALLSWGRAQSVKTAYLQVSENNTGAQMLYQHFGFRTLYPYYYLEAP